MISETSKRNAEMLGIQTLLFQTQEECGELIKAIGKYNRANGIGQKTEVDKDEAFKNVLEELADVSICVEQLIYLSNHEAYINHCKNKAFEKVAKRYSTPEGEE